MIGKDFSIYVHIPFCKKKCPYCHFFSFPATDTTQDTFLQALLTEISLQKEKLHNKNLLSLYFGGGTPFLFTPKRLEKVLERLSQYISLPAEEITLEVNPSCVTKGDLLAYKNLGVNRLSFGAQSFNERELIFLGREHSPQDIFTSVQTASYVGFENISVDLMYDLPDQTLDSLNHSLLSAFSLPIKHISIYNLMIEEPSFFYRKKTSLEKNMPSPELSESMYKLILERTEEKEFFQYEISAFAKKGFKSLHNCGYWEGREFLGCGPSAFSFMDNTRFSNPAHFVLYCSSLEKGILPPLFSETLSPEEKMREMLAVGLRMNEGVHLPSFQKKWGELTEDLMKTLAWLQSLELLHMRGETVTLSQKGRLVYDTIATELI